MSTSPWFGSTVVAGLPRPATSSDTDIDGGGLLAGLHGDRQAKHRPHTQRRS